uniref:Uncharacterized protein n=1 Tax=Salix viminalis TaxID=40686 RepID=A0A6N2N362_SALVM
MLQTAHPRSSYRT